MRANTQKTIYLGAASFLCSIASMFSLGWGLSLAFALLSCIAGGAYAMTLLVSPSRLCRYIPIAAVICGFFITMNAPSAILAAFPFALGAIISSCAKKRSEKTSAIVFCDIALGAIFIISLALAYCIENKTLAASAVVSDINGMFEEIKLQLAKIFDGSNVYESYSKYYDLSDVTEAEFCLELAGEMVLLTKMISPAVMICMLNVISYVTCAMFSLAARISSTSIAIPGGKWYLVPSSISCYVMIAASILWYLSSLFTSSGTSLVIEYASANLLIILALPMFICGVRGLVGKFRSPSYKGSATLITIIAVIMMFVNAIYGVLFIALEGAWDLIGYHRAMKRSAKRQ